MPIRHESNQKLYFILTAIIFEYAKGWLHIHRNSNNQFDKKKHFKLLTEIGTSNLVFDGTVFIPYTGY